MTLATVLMPIDLVEMGFILALLALGAGFALMYPLARHLGTLLERRLVEPSSRDVDPRVLSDLSRAVLQLNTEVARLAERQRFIESLLDSRNRADLLPRAGIASADDAPP